MIKGARAFPVIAVLCPMKRGNPRVFGVDRGKAMACTACGTVGVMPMQGAGLGLIGLICRRAFEYFNRPVLPVIKDFNALGIA